MITYEEVEEFLNTFDFNLRPGQEKVSFPIIERIYLRLKKGKRFDPIEINGDLLIDGHHRYISSMLLGIESATKLAGRNISQLEYVWKDVILEKDDYDSEDKIKEYLQKYD